MLSQKKFIVSHAPFWHCGNGVVERHVHTIYALLPAAVVGILTFGVNAIGVLCLAVGSAMLWEWMINRAAKRPITIADGHAALLGLLFGMLLPPNFPWYAVIVGTFTVIVIGKEIFGGIGSNPVNTAALAVAILMVSWADLFNFDAAFVNMNFSFPEMVPVVAAKYFKAAGAAQYSLLDLLVGRQTGAIGATFGIGLILGGLYLIYRGFIRWEIPIAFLAGIFVTAILFQIVDPSRYVNPLFHLLSGYTLIGAFFLATDPASAPINPIPMLLYGAIGGIMTVLIRNVGAHVDGVVYAILVINLLNPLLDKIRPKAIGKVV